MQVTSYKYGVKMNTTEENQFANKLLICILGICKYLRVDVYSKDCILLSQAIQVLHQNYELKQHHWDFLEYLNLILTKFVFLILRWLNQVTSQVKSYFHFKLYYGILVLLNKLNRHFILNLAISRFLVYFLFHYFLIIINYSDLLMKMMVP